MKKNNKFGKPEKVISKNSVNTIVLLVGTLGFKFLLGNFFLAAMLEVI